MQNACVVMNEQHYKIWVAQLPSLTATQCSDVITRLKLCLQATKQPSGKQEFADRVLQAICSVMIKNKVECPSVISLRKSSAYAIASKNQKFYNLSIFFDSISKSKLVQDQILKEAIGLLYYDMLQWDIAVSAHTVLKQIHRIPSVLNRAFPGYATSNVLTKLVKGG